MGSGGRAERGQLPVLLCLAAHFHSGLPGGVAWRPGPAEIPEGLRELRENTEGLGVTREESLHRLQVGTETMGACGATGAVAEASRILRGTVAFSLVATMYSRFDILRLCSLFLVFVIVTVPCASRARLETGVALST